jgi:hypothetical protein
VVPGGGAALIVANPGVEPLSVVVDGRLLGVAAPAQATVFSNVFPGHRAVVLTNPYGQMRSSSRVFIPIGGAYTYSVQGGPAFHPQYGAMLGQGEVQVHNRFQVPVTVFIAGRHYGVVFPGQTAIYYNLPAGPAHFMASNRDLPAQILMSQQIQVIARSRIPVQISPAGGFLRLVNSRNEWVDVSVDGRPDQRLGPNSSTLVAGVEVGHRELTAHAGGREIQKTRAPIYQGQTYTWYVRAPSGSLRIVNRTGEWITLRIDGKPRGRVQPMRQHFVSNLPLGQRNLLALRPNGLVLNSQQIDMGEGQIRVWMLHPPRPPQPAYRHVQLRPPPFSPPPAQPVTIRAQAMPPPPASPPPQAQPPPAPQAQPPTEPAKSGVPDPKPGEAFPPEPPAQPPQPQPEPGKSPPPAN